MTQILIIGGGAIGSFFAARLVEAGNDVRLIARGNRLSAIKRNGILIEGGGSVKQIKVRANSDIQKRAPVDMICQNLSGRHQTRQASKGKGTAGKSHRQCNHADPGLVSLSRKPYAWKGQI